MTTNKIYLSKIGFLSNKFHEFWCSELFCRIYSKYASKDNIQCIYNLVKIGMKRNSNFYSCKGDSNKHVKQIIVKSSSRRSKWIYCSYILENKRDTKFTNLRGNQHSTEFDMSTKPPWPSGHAKAAGAQLVTTRVFGEAKNMNFLKFFLQYVKHEDARSN